MKAKKSFPVEKDKITVGKKYYTCGYSGVFMVTVIRIYPADNKVLVRVKNDKFSPFIRTMDYIFDNPQMAKGAQKKWESSMRHKKEVRSINYRFVDLEPRKRKNRGIEERIFSSIK